MSEPRKLEDCPEYTQAQAKLHELVAERNVVANEIRDVAVGLHRPPDTIGAEALAYLDGENTAKAREPALREQFTALTHQQNILDAAIQMQRKRLDVAREVASRTICETLAPAWKERAKKIRDAAIVLADLGDEQHAFFADLERQGIFMPQKWLQASTQPATCWQLKVLGKMCTEALEM